jgi:hypothetical protein
MIFLERRRKKLQPDLLFKKIKSDMDLRISRRSESYIYTYFILQSCDIEVIHFECAVVFVEVNLCSFSIVCLYLYCHISDWESWDPINQFNPVTYLCLSQAWTIPPISTKWTTTSHLKPLNAKIKTTTYGVWNPNPAWDRHKYVTGLNWLMGSQLIA